MWNIRLAEKHVPIIRRLLAKHPEYRDVLVTMTTADNGAIMIDGYVFDRAQQDRLKNIVEATGPPVLVRYQWRKSPGNVSNSPR